MPYSQINETLLGICVSLYLFFSMVLFLEFVEKLALVSSIIGKSFWLSEHCER